MARKVDSRELGRRKEPVNRAQLKALAARQAMTAAAARAAEPRSAEDAAAAAPVAAEFLPRSRRRATITREQEYFYIKRDLIRLGTISVLLLVVMLVVLLALR